uniref:Pleckstrin homology and RhoGEF domain containing G3 n=1 Tax=Acanthochromis polyacanthus TaxID=80966 RepID=A0A3Q1GC99_9TELE
ATPSDSSDLPTSDRRPASLISTLSSGSGSSRDDNLAPPPSSGRSFIHNNNNNNKERTTSRASSRRQPGSPFISGSMAPNPQLTYLDRVVMEIIETERMYVRDLRMIVEDYLAHIIDQSDLSIRPEQVCSLFGNIEDIYEFNSELLQALDMCDNDPVAVARCFVMKVRVDQKVAGGFIYLIFYSVAALTECMRNKSLAKFFRERQASLKRSLPLGSYLLKPVQRILKYHLLLQEIAKHFDPEEEGYEVVEEAIYTMTGVAWYINDMKRKHEHAVRLQEVQSLLLNWKGPDLTTYGELVLEGTFKVHRAKNERTLFLFDRMLLITKRRGEHYVYKTHISCSTLMLIESAKDSLSFSVTHYKHPKQPHTVQAKTVEEKKLWAHHIKRIILENHHAIIPQKAKEAILEMDSICKYQSFLLVMVLVKILRKLVETVRKQDKTALGFFLLSSIMLFYRRPFQVPLQSRASTLGSSSLGESEADRAAQDEEEQEEEGEELGSRKDSLERLMCSEEEEDDEAGRLDEVLLEDEQVEDFASSVLAAISCWHYTVQAFLSSTGTVRLSAAKGPEPTEEPCSATPDSDSKTLSSGESSEEEDDDEKEAAEKVLKSPSILPSSVLDKASAIAQHFTNSIKRGSMAQDDARSLGCASPRLPSRTGSSVSLCTEPADRPLRLNSISSDSVETFGVTDLTMLSPRDDSLFDADRGIRRRRDSTLSKQDQLLIGKIKTYYENAENQDATFSLQRRESLTYIPTGLVRSSVSRFNSIPREETVQTNPSTSLDPSSVHSNSALPSDHMDNPCEDEDFRPSSEMIKIWQAMEREISRSQKSAASDLSTITEESISPSPLKSKVSGVNRTGSLKDALKVFGEEAFILRAPVPRVIQLRAESEMEKPSEDSNQLDDVDTGKSKVLHLARQYSQRIKTSRPVVRERSQGGLIAKKSLACVVEEKESSGTLFTCKPNLTLPLVSHKQSTSLPLSPVDQIRSPTPGLTCSSVGGSRGVSPGRVRSRSPLSPPPPIEAFNWPDVSELRSKYSNHSQKTPVGRSRSIPEQIREERSKRLHRANSLDPRLSGAQMSDLEPAKPQELEKTAAASTAQDVPQRSRSNSGQKTETAQKSIVKNLREKFQSLS